MGNNNGLPFLVFAVLDCQHVNFPLVDSQLAEVHVQEKDISALHARIKELGNLELVRLFFAHDGSTLLNTGNSILTSNVHHSHPVFV